MWLIIPRHIQIYTKFANSKTKNLKFVCVHKTFRHRDRAVD